MIKSITSTVINLPMPEVFTFLQTVENYPSWQQEITAITATNGMRVGSHVAYTRSSTLGQNMTATIKILENNGRDRMASESVNGKFKAHTVFELTPAGRDKTEMVIKIEAEATALPKEAEAALQYITDTRTQEDLDRLKAVLEQAEEPQR